MDHNFWLFKRNMRKLVVAQDSEIYLSHANLTWRFVTRRNEINGYYAKYTHYQEV